LVLATKKDNTLQFLARFIHSSVYFLSPEVGEKSSKSGPGFSNPCLRIRFEVVFVGVLTLLSNVG